ncbi:hypothetical protein CBL_00813 [Carabus blaptoides fortunei]
MKLKINSGRLTYEPKYNFRDGVLIGNNWYEEKLKYVKDRYKHDSTYSREFYEKERSSVPSEILWNHKIRGEGAGLQCVMDYEKEKYLENFSTTYDVSYNVLPKEQHNIKLKKYNARLQHYIPQQDLTKNFGNVTGYGLKGRKTCQWQYEQNTDPSSWISETHDNYKLLSSENYKTKRRAIPRAFSSILCETNLRNVHLPFRNTQISVVPDIPLKVQPRTYPHFYF